jgi:hypothetical protein
LNAEDDVAAEALWEKAERDLRIVTMVELQQHGTAGDCWVVIHG